MPPFASFWQGIDIEQKKDIGLIDAVEAENEKNSLQLMRRTLGAFLRNIGFLNEPDDNTLTVLKACLIFLAASSARIVLVNMEDLWLETQPQNFPSTTSEYPNWRKKAAYYLEEFGQMPHLIDILNSIKTKRNSVK
jgi:4-alpha-glucanotransferase